MSYTVRVPSLPPVTKAPVPMNVARNGVTAGGYSVQQNIAAYANALLGRTVKKVLFEQHARPILLPLGLSGSYVWGRFAGHTSPGVARVRFEVSMCPGSTSGSPPNPIKVVLDQETGLTGSGTTSTPATIFATELATAIAPERYSTQYVDFDITPDQDYRWTLTAYDGMRVFSASLYELPRETADPSTVTGAVDSTLISTGQAVCDETVEDVLVCADKLWRRGGPRLFGWADACFTSFGLAINSATYVNAFDNGVTTVSSTSPGFPVRLQYHHSLDSTNVGVTFYAYAKMAAAGTGSIRFFSVDGTTLATIAVSGANTWYTATGTMVGTNATDKIDVHIKGDGADRIEVRALGAFRYVT